MDILTWSLVGGAFGAFVTALAIRDTVARRRSRAALTGGADNHAAPDDVVPPALGALGLTEPFRHVAGGELGARGTIGGLAVVGAYSPSNDDGPRYYLAVSLAGVLPDAVRVQLEGVRRVDGDLALGEPRFDDRIAVVGPRAALVLHFDAEARRRLLDAVDAGWRPEPGKLVRDQLPAESLARYLEPGLSAARALVVSDPARRLADIARRDPAMRMRRRALHLLFHQHPASPSAKATATELARSTDPVLALLARRAAMPPTAWSLEAFTRFGLEDDGLVELGEALADLGMTEVLPLVGSRLAATTDDETRRVLAECKRVLQAKAGAVDGGLSLAERERDGGLSLPAGSESEPH